MRELIFSLLRTEIPLAEPNKHLPISRIRIFFINESNIGWAHAFSFAIFPLSPSCECQKVKIITFSYSSKKPKRLRNHRPPLLNHVRCQFCVAHVVERLD